jgi:hypothetical protein
MRNNRYGWRGDGNIGSLLHELQRLGVGENVEVDIHNTVAQTEDPGIIKKEYALGVYKGNFLGEKRHGKGELLYKDFDYYFPKRYDGEWQDDKIQGRGVMEYNDRSVYSGSWKNGIRDGEGELKYNNGDTYIGCWEKDMRVGQGLIIFKNKNEYEGVWKSDKFSDGTYTNNSKNWSFRGTFDDVYPKAGTLTYSDNEQTLEIHSQSWRRVSIHEQTPVSVDTKPTEIQKTHTTQKKSTMNDYFQKIRKCASDIYDEVDLWLERVEDARADKERLYSGPRGHYTH